MVGLDAAGKTTILYKLKLGEGSSYSHDIERHWSSFGMHSLNKRRIPLLL